MSIIHRQFFPHFGTGLFNRGSLRAKGAGRPSALARACYIYRRSLREKGALAMTTLQVLIIRKLGEIRGQTFCSFSYLLYLPEIASGKRRPRDDSSSGFNN